MSKYWQQFSDWYDARKARERILIMIVNVVALISFWMVLISDPQALKREQLKIEHAKIKTQEYALQAQINAIVVRARQDPNKANEQKIAQLLNNIDAINERLEKKMRGFVDPGHMARVLEDVLKQKANLNLIRLESLPAEFIFVDANEKNQNQAKPGLYRHGFKMELQGSYLNTLGYLKLLEDLPWDFYWDGIDIEVIKYPQAKIVLQLHTLSLKESWIGV